MAAQYGAARVYILCLLALVGCARHDSHAARYSAELVLAKADKPVLQRKAGDLAYEHTVSIELDEAALAGRVHEMQAACATDARFAYELTLRTGGQRALRRAGLRRARRGLGARVQGHPDQCPSPEDHVDSE
jgi:hypothetical protein